MNSTKCTASTAVACLLFSSVACNDEVTTEVNEQAGVATEAIENGTVYQLTDAVLMKEVRMERADGSTLGSGALLRNNWVLTAAHLFPDARLASPSTTLRVRLGNEVLWGSEIFIDPNGEDVALVRLQSGFLIDGSREKFSRPIYSGTPASLVGKTLDCWGYGANDPSGNGAGTLRRASQAVVESGANWIGVERNALAQLLTTGDSGAVCFYNGQATSVHNYRYDEVNGTYTRGYETHATAFRSWALYDVIDRQATKLHRVTLSCTGVAQSGEQVVDLSGGYSNYRCKSRYQEQCIDDGSFDGYYMEWCDYSGDSCRKVAPGKYFCDPGKKPTTGTCTATKLFRTVRACDGTLQRSEVMVDLTTGYSNYTCGSRFLEQCVNDGSWDGFYSEWCEYTCT